MRGELAQLIRRQHARVAPVVDIDEGDRRGAPAVIDRLARVVAVVDAILVQKDVVVFVREVCDENASRWGRCSCGGYDGCGADGDAVSGAGGCDRGDGRNGGEAGDTFGDLVAGDVCDAGRCAFDDPAEIGICEGVDFARLGLCGIGWGGRGGHAG